LRKDREILGKVAAIFSKPPEMKYRFMAEHRGTHRVEKMATNLWATRGGFYAWVLGGQTPVRKRTSGWAS
jgi:hypothetical protein